MYFLPLTSSRETVTGIAKTQKEQYSNLRTGMSELRQSALEAQAQHKIDDNKKFARFSADTQASLSGIRTEVSDFNSDIGNRLEEITAATSSMDMSLMSIQDLGKQIISFLSSFPVEMRDLLRKVHAMNMQIYYILLHQPRSMAPSPSEFLDARIELLDCMGRKFQLPYEWFCRWEVCIELSN